MANITTYLNNIKNAMFGKDVRDSIHDAIKQCYDDASTKGNANMEVTLARGKYNNLNERLDNHSSQIKEKANLKEVRKKDVNITLNDCDSNMLGAIQDGEGANFELLSIPRENSVSFNKLESKLQDSFYPNYENVQLTFNQNGFWDKDSGYIQENEGIITYSNEIDVTENDAFIITGKSSYRSNLYIIKDIDNTIIDVFPNTNEPTKIYNNISFVIPPKGKKLCINSLSDYPTVLRQLDTLKIDGDKIIYKNNSINKGILENKLSSLFIPSDFKNVTLNWINGSYYRYKNNAINDHKDFSRTKISVNAGENYKITGTSYWEANLFYIIDKFGEILQTYPNTNETTKIYKNYEFTIPENGAYLLINQKNDVINTTLDYSYGYEVVVKNTLSNKKWVAFGDSLTDSYTLGDDYNYTNFIADNLNLELINCGKGGTGYINGNGGTQQFYNRTSSIPNDTDILTVFGSFNDLYMDNIPIGSITDTEPTTLYGAINKFLNNCWNINPSMIIGIISPTPWHNWWRGHSDTSRSNKCVEYVEVLKTVAEYYSLPFLDLFNCSNLRPWEQRIKDLYYLNADGVHPNSLGHEKYIVPKVENFIKSVIN